MEKYRITTKAGRVITLLVDTNTETHLIGTDKYGKQIVLNKEMIDDCFPISGGDSYVC